MRTGGSGRQHWTWCGACLAPEATCRREAAGALPASKGCSPARRPPRQLVSGSANWPRIEYEMTTESVHSRERYERLLQVARSLPPVTTAVAHPCDEVSLKGTVKAAQLGLISPI